MTGEAGPPHVTVAELLAEARAGIPRFTPAEAHAAATEGGLLIDIRSEGQREKAGAPVDAHWIPRNVLEWRLDPASPHRAPELATRDRTVILLCAEGYQSSLAAATLRRFGLDAGDVEGGFEAWRADGLPATTVDRPG